MKQPGNKRGRRERVRRAVLDRTSRLIELDALLQARGEPGVLEQPEDVLSGLEALLLGPATPDGLTTPTGQAVFAAQKRPDCLAPTDGPVTPDALAVPDGPPSPDALTDQERRAWVRRHLRVLRGGREDPA